MRTCGARPRLMDARTLLMLVLCLGAFALGRGSPSWWPSVQAEPVQAEEARRVFELRLYTVEDGKVGRLSEVFRDNVTQMFARHGMTNAAYLLPRDEPQCGTFRAGATIREPAFDYGPCPWSRDTLVYLLAHDSPAAAERSWASFVPGGLRASRRQGAADRLRVPRPRRVLGAALGARGPDRRSGPRGV